MWLVTLLLLSIIHCLNNRNEMKLMLDPVIRQKSFGTCILMVYNNYCIINVHSQDYATYCWWCKQFARLKLCDACYNNITITNDYVTIHYYALKSSNFLSLSFLFFFFCFLLFQNYINIILAHPLLVRHISVKKFLDPANYSCDFQGKINNNCDVWFDSAMTYLAFKREILISAETPSGR